MDYLWHNLRLANDSNTCKLVKNDVPFDGSAKPTSKGLQGLSYPFRFCNSRVIKQVTTLDSVIKVYIPKNRGKSWISLADTRDFVWESWSYLSLSHT